MIGTTLVEGQYGKSPIIFAVDDYSLENITLASGQKLVAGTILGKISYGAATAAAVAGNTGNGTCSAVTVGVGAKVGVYRVTFIKATTNLGTFIVEGPDGIQVGAPGVVGTAYTGGGLTFTLSDGATDFVAGDQFTITVAAGSGKYIALDPTATNGAAVCAGIAYAGVKTATSVDGAGVVIRRHAKLNKDEIDWLSLDAGQITTAIADLAALGVIVEASI